MGFERGRNGEMLEEGGLCRGRLRWRETEGGWEGG